ncbi:hypothetical protein E2320_006383, partial [Naja naja]
MQMVTLAMRK